MKLTRHHRPFRGALMVFVTLCALVGLTPRAFASPAFDAANRAFAEGRYTDAATQYEALIDQEGYSAPVLFDLGNAYLRDGKPALARLAYERAQLLAPRDSAIATNLVEARKAAGVGGERGMVYRVSHTLTADEWTWMGAAAFWLLIAAGGGAFLFPRRRAWLLSTASACALVGALSFAGLSGSLRDQRAALVLKPTPVLVSPFDGAQSSFSLVPGSEVEFQRTHDRYVLVRDRQGRSGWVERSSVARLVVDGAKLDG